MDCMDIKSDIEIKEEPLEEEYREKNKLDPELPSEDTQSEMSSMPSKKIKLEKDGESLENGSSTIFSEAGILKSMREDLEESHDGKEESNGEEKYELQNLLQNYSNSDNSKLNEEREVDSGGALSSYVNAKDLIFVSTDQAYAHSIFHVPIRPKPVEGETTEQGHRPEEEPEPEKIWPHKRTLLLLNTLKEEKEHYRCPYDRNKAFKNVHRKFIENNYTLSIKDIKRKWRNLTRTYRTNRDRCKLTGEEKQTWPYYDMVHDIYECEGSRETTPSEVAGNNELLDGENLTESLELERKRKLSLSTSSSRKKSLKPCTEADFREYAFKSLTVLEEISSKMSKINEGVCAIAKSINENALAITKLSSTMERYIQGVIVKVNK